MRKSANPGLCQLPSGRQSADAGPDDQDRYMLRLGRRWELRLAQPVSEFQ
jgi:hypothetical protein